MLKELELERFKNFKKEKLVLAPLTLLVGANASGKSNIRDAFRFLHGISRGYTVGEIMGEKYGDGGERLWGGIRGGFREATFQAVGSFAMKVKFTIQEPQSDKSLLATYRIEVDPSGYIPKVVNERLEIEGLNEAIIAHSKKQPTLYQPLISQLDAFPAPTRELLSACLAAFSQMRFFDFHPDVMRQPSFPGRAILGDRGENLASVLQIICQNTAKKEILIQWIQELIPTDVQDLQFDNLPNGKILLRLVEQNGQRITADSASDGTLRFLAMMASLFAPKPAHFYFFEEIENGIYPARIHLLLQLFEQKTARNSIQIVASTHSPQLLNLANRRTLEAASFIYRFAGQPSAHIKRILALPEVPRVIAEQDIARLHATGWLDDVVFFMDDEEEEAS